MHVIEQPLPPAPEAGAEPNIVAQWTALYDAHTEIACLMLGSMTPELHRQFELHYPYDTVQELRSMFKKQAGVEKFDLNHFSMLATRVYLRRLKHHKYDGLKVVFKIQRPIKNRFNEKGKNKVNGKERIRIGHWEKELFLCILLSCRRKGCKFGSASSSGELGLKEAD
ncbi:hypothetical protein Tco_1370173 [Tanacetum coccineum]